MGSAAGKRTARALKAGKSPLGGEYGAASRKALAKNSIKPQVSKRPAPSATPLSAHGSTFVRAMAGVKSAPDRSGMKITNRRADFSGGYSSVTGNNNFVGRDEASRKEFGTTWSATMPLAHPALLHAAKSGPTPATSSSEQAVTPHGIAYKVKAALGMGYKGTHRRG